MIWRDGVCVLVCGTEMERVLCACGCDGVEREWDC